MEDCWDLQAVVRGSYCVENDYFSAAASGNMFDPPPPLPPCFEYSPPAYGEDFLEMARVAGELEDIYKPFYPAATDDLFSNFTSSAATCQSDEHGQAPEVPVASEASSSPPLRPPAAASSPQKKRKNRHGKKVVHQIVTSDGVSSDLWAWRKYGQKPIKGSPYPRSYYRCSSSKGCLARKQVERSVSDPAKFIVTYSGEHDHAYPTRRSTLAGSTRNNKLASTAATTKQTTSGDTPPTVLASIKEDSSDCSPNSSNAALSTSATFLGAAVEEDDDANFAPDIMWPSDELAMGFSRPGGEGVMMPDFGLDVDSFGWFDDLPATGF